MHAHVATFCIRYLCFQDSHSFLVAMVTDGRCFDKQLLQKTLEILRPNPAKYQAFQKFLAEVEVVEAEVVNSSNARWKGHEKICSGYGGRG